MGWDLGNGARLRMVAAAALLMLTPSAASAQQTRSIQPGMQQFVPSGGPGAIGPGQTLVPQTPIPSGPPLAAPNAAIPAGQVGLVLTARYGRDFAQPINGNLVWRVYPVRPDHTGAFRPINEEKSA